MSAVHARKGATRVAQPSGKGGAVTHGGAPPQIVLPTPVPSKRTAGRSELTDLAEKAARHRLNVLELAGAVGDVNEAYRISMVRAWFDESVEVFSIKGWHTIIRSGSSRTLSENR